MLIDEPTVGLAPNLVAQVYRLLSAAKSATGAAILLVEQNVEQALPLADYLYLLNLGQVKAEGPGPGIRQRARARTGAGMSAGLTRGLGAFVDWRRVAAVLAIAAPPLLVLPLFVGEFAAHVLAISAYYVILAASWNMLAGFTGQFSLAQHGFAALGAYTSGLLVYHLQTPLWISIPGGRADDGVRRLSPGPAGTENARDLPVDRHLGIRRDAAHISHRCL